MQPKKHEDKQGLTGLYELFLLTVPIEEIAHGQNKTVLTYSLLTSRQLP